LAERVILELKEKMSEEAFLRKVEASASKRGVKQEPADELVDALLALGYKRSEVEAVAGEARESADNVEDQLRFALRSLQR
jgi:Holliday junction resolvasome RuvABC DNA-binding subunit